LIESINRKDVLELNSETKWTVCIERRTRNIGVHSCREDTHGPCTNRGKILNNSASLYMVETATLALILHNSDEASLVYHRIKEGLPLINQNDIVL
jgi:hypothetical protein